MIQRVIIFVLYLFITTPSYADEPKLHPIEQLCVSYELSGQMQNGSTTRCHRKYGYEQYEIQNITIGIAGFTQSQHSHNITIGDTIYAIDLEKKTCTKTKNPMYEQISSNVQGKSREEMSELFITSMGFSPTGEIKDIADHQCQVYNSPQLGTSCLTPQGIMLEQSVMGSVTTAVAVYIGEQGDEDNYTLYKSVTITEGPDLSNFNLQDLINQQ